MGNSVHSEMKWLNSEKANTKAFIFWYLSVVEKLYIFEQQKDSVVKLINQNGTSNNANFIPKSLWRNVVHYWSKVDRYKSRPRETNKRYILRLHSWQKKKQPFASIFCKEGLFWANLTQPKSHLRALSSYFQTHINWIYQMRY